MARRKKPPHVHPQPSRARSQRSHKTIVLHSLGVLGVLAGNAPSCLIKDGAKVARGNWSEHAPLPKIARHGRPRPLSTHGDERAPWGLLPPSAGLARCYVAGWVIGTPPSDSGRSRGRALWRTSLKEGCTSGHAPPFAPGGLPSCDSPCWQGGLRTVQLPLSKHPPPLALRPVAAPGRDKLFCA